MTAKIIVLVGCLLCSELTQAQQSGNMEAMNYEMLLEKYNNGSRNGKILRPLAEQAKSQDKELAKKVAAEYIAGLTDKDIQTKDNALFVFDFTNSSKDPGYIFLVNNMNKLEKLSPKLHPALVKGKLVSIISGEAIFPYYSKEGMDLDKIVEALKPYGALGKELTEKQIRAAATVEVKKKKVFENEIKPFLETKPEWQEVVSKIKEQKEGVGEEYLFGTTIIYYLYQLGKDKEFALDRLIKVCSYYENNFPEYLWPGGLNQQAWAVFENTDNKKYLLEAARWAKKAVELSPEPEIIDTYANLLYRVGKVEEAIKWEQKAFDIDQGLEWEMNIKKMKAGEPTWPESKQ